MGVRMKPSGICIVVLIIGLIHLCTSQLVNVDVSRKIDIRTHLELVTTTIRLRNDGSKSVEEFLFSQDPRSAGRVGDIFAAAGNKVSKSSELLSVRHGQLPHTHTIALPSALEPDSEVTITVVTDYRGTLYAVPSEITASEDQYMRYVGNAYWYTAYKTERQKTTIALPSGKVKSHSELPNPHHVKSYQIVLGPYDSISGYSRSEYNLRVLNNRGFLEAIETTLTYHVSHWGRIHTREEYALTNAAAKLRGEWSRADYKPELGGGGIAYGDVWANLPSASESIVYADAIGNITTSHLRESDGRKRAMQLRFRYPLLGGWHVRFWYSYAQPLAGLLRTAGDQHELTIGALPTLDYDLPIGEHCVRVSLPEGAKDVEVVPHSTMHFDVTHEIVRATLAYAGRPTVVLKRRNVRSEAPHAAKVTVRYTYTQTNMLKAPATVIAGLLAFFSMILIVSRSGMGSAALDANEVRTIHMASRVK